MSEDGFGTVPNALLDIKDARIAELEAALAEARYRIDGMITDHDDTRAALAERDRMLMKEYESSTPRMAGYMRWYEDLRARAEEGKS